MKHDNLNERPRVLIVDDMAENLFAMRQLLAEVDADLITAQSGNEALGLMLQQQFCVVLLDVQMPEMDGFETAELMRSHEDTKSTPIIFLTAISKEDRHVFHGYAAGAVDYLFKPVVPEILLSKVKVFIELYQAMQLARQLEREQRKSANLESIGTLAGGLAHDFNNLLFAVLGNIELAQDDISHDPVQARKFLSRAKDALLMGKELTSLMITFSKGGQPKKKMCSLGELLREAVAAHTLTPGITCEVRIAEGLPEVELDWGLMRQAIDNILANACEAMAHGGRLTITADTELSTVGVGRIHQEAPQVTVRIADTGCGIGEDVIERVFDPYFSTKERCSSKGMGLGLSVANSIIRNHHGAITLHSTKGEGTVVLITLPLGSQQRSNSLGTPW
jgi:signal transduction histidine kinase